MANPSYKESDLRRTLESACSHEQVFSRLYLDSADWSLIEYMFVNYNDLARSIRNAAYIAFMVKLSSIFDNDSRSVTLKSIPEIEADPAFPDLWRRGRIIYDCRSKTIAHRDEKNETTNFVWDMDLTYLEIRAILSDACAIYDRFALTKSLPTVAGLVLRPSEQLTGLMKRVSGASQGG